MRRWNAKVLSFGGLATNFLFDDDTMDKNVNSPQTLLPGVVQLPPDLFQLYVLQHVS